VDGSRWQLSDAALATLAALDQDFGVERVEHFGERVRAHLRDGSWFDVDQDGEAWPCSIYEGARSRSIRWSEVEVGDVLLLPDGPLAAQPVNVLAEGRSIFEPGRRLLTVCPVGAPRSRAIGVRAADSLAVERVV